VEVSTVDKEVCVGMCPLLAQWMDSSSFCTVPGTKQRSTRVRIKLIFNYLYLKLTSEVIQKPRMEHWLHGPIGFPSARRARKEHVLVRRARVGSLKARALT
jgi:hypothetical protein